MTTSLMDGTVIDEAGLPIAAVTCTVRDSLGALASLVDSLGAPKANPLTTSSLGYWSCWVPAGTYSIVIAKGASSRTLTRVVATTVIEQVLVDAKEMVGTMRVPATGFTAMPDTFNQFTPD